MEKVELITKLKEIVKPYIQDQQLSLQLLIQP